MRFTRDLSKLSIIGLVVLAVLAVALSAAALLSTRTVPAEPAPSGAPLAPDSSSETPSADPTPSPTPEPSSEPTSEAPEEEPTTSDTPSSEPTEPESPATSGNTVVVIGDSFSLGDDAWVSTAAEELGWGDVVNLASPGRGYLTAPRSCDFEPCARFGGSVDLIAEGQPELVVTFGGTADGDYALDDAPSDYFAALREALPDAELVAINPVTGDSPAPYWLTLHAQNIRAAVEAVDGTFINVGQPGAGDGDTLTAETQNEIARAVVEALS